jgi:hypothetical protein
VRDLDGLILDRHHAVEPGARADEDKDGVHPSASRDADGRLNGSYPRRRWAGTTGRCPCQVPPCLRAPCSVRRRALVCGSPLVHVGSTLPVPPDQLLKSDGCRWLTLALCIPTAAPNAVPQILGSDCVVSLIVLDLKRSVTSRDRSPLPSAADPPEHDDVHKGLLARPARGPHPLLPDWPRPPGYPARPARRSPTPTPTDASPFADGLFNRCTLA